ncbi:hypothetical protein BDV37DRAFT_175026 [Aspergillus pseudonomiae]|uniref:DUF6594 domain-containing protein n=1 Tax=Aspergillus pseudonomiae TaxID=1506151 RepID=A0A5N7D5L9_9EURO|nr:uncharacterized protein BDV37DRAFT_175026 [Aspergillus pseudonomiae]KAE8401695.1 hypothetical protein BDV37DRAFT_175026 [Aspergillus pseudonomiae]
MLLYSGSRRSKKASKDGGNKASTASVASGKSHSTSKTSRSSGDAAKKKSTSEQSAGSKNNVPSSTKAQNTQATRNPTFKAAEPEKSMPNVFEYLESGSNTDSDDSYVEDDDVLNRNLSGSFRNPHVRLARQANMTAQGMGAPSRTSSIRSKGSMDSYQIPGMLELSTRNGSARRKMSMEGYLTEESNGSDKRKLRLSPMPESYEPSHDPTTFHPPFPPSPPQSPEEDLHHINRKSRRKKKSSSIPSGYGRLSWQLSSSVEKEEPSLPPLYRRFEDVNHRVLLYLQDEIAQMEEELHVLDEYEEMHRVATAEQEGTNIVPASRRMDAQAQVYSSLHYRREEVMAALVQKTQQYNNALSAYSKVTQALPSASDKDIDMYRAWMKENAPVAVAETRFLEHNKDLISLTTGSTSNAPSAFSAIIIASAAILLPLLAFSMIAEFSGRLLVVAMVGGAASAIASNSAAGAERFVASHDGWRIATLYFGFMTIAAMFIP